MEKEKHLSDSRVQLDVEKYVLDKLQTQQGFKAPILPFSLHLNTYRFNVDGAIGIKGKGRDYQFDKEIHLFEVYAGFASYFRVKKERFRPMY